MDAAHPSPADSPPNCLVGPRIRALREERRLSLRALAEASGLSLNAISRIERGENSPTVASLYQLAAALAVPVTDFFRPAETPATIFIQQRQRLLSRQAGVAMESLGAGLLNQQLEPFLLTLAAGAGAPPSEDEDDRVSHSGQEFVYCLSGSVVYYVGAAQYPLEPGDSLLFEAKQPHGFHNPSADPTMLLLIFLTTQGGDNARRQHLAAATGPGIE